MYGNAFYYLENTDRIVWKSGYFQDPHRCGVGVTRFFLLMSTELGNKHDLGPLHRLQLRRWVLRRRSSQLLRQQYPHLSSGH